MIGKAIYEICTTTVDINTMIDGSIYPLVVPMGVGFPAAVYTVASDDPSISKNEPTTITDSTVQIKAMHPNFKQAQILAGHIRTAFDNLSGEVAGVDIDTVKYRGTTPLFDENAQVYQVILTFNFFYKY